jgi:hypothetical protein
LSAPAKRSATRRERLVVELFRVHWRAVAADLSKGIDVAKDRARWFFASDQRKRLRLARRYYAPARVAKLADTTADEILHLTDVWLSAFRDYCECNELEGKAVRDELRQLVFAEYVAVSSDLPDPYGFIRQESTTVNALPSEGVLYDDVYEITASGVSSGARLVICKSVAEPFGEAERFETTAGIENDFFANAASDGEPEGGWQINFLESEDPRVIAADIKPGGNSKRARPGGHSRAYGLAQIEPRSALHVSVHSPRFSGYKRRFGPRRNRGAEFNLGNRGQARRLCHGHPLDKLRADSGHVRSRAGCPWHFHGFGLKTPVHGSGRFTIAWSLGCAVAKPYKCLAHSNRRDTGLWEVEGREGQRLDRAAGVLNAMRRPSEVEARASGRQRKNRSTSFLRE